MLLFNEGAGDCELQQAASVLCLQTRGLRWSLTAAHFMSNHGFTRQDQIPMILHVPALGAACGFNDKTPSTWGLHDSGRGLSVRIAMFLCC